MPTASVPRFSAAVVGLGRIGQGFDDDASAEGVVRTHATAFAVHPGYELVAGVDPDPAERERFGKKFGRPAYETVAALLGHHPVDVVSIGVPTARHGAVLEALLRDAAPRAVLCEKPIAPSVAEANAMVALAEAKACVLAVNYMRRFEPGVLALRRAIEAGAVGSVYKGAVWYSKGLHHNGSHFIDLLVFLLGDAVAERVIDAGRAWDGVDPEPDAVVRFGDATVFLLAAREECHPAGDVTLMGTKGVARYAERGRVIQVCRTGGGVETIASDLVRYQWHVADALYRHLTEGAALASTGRTATRTLAVVEEIVRLREEFG